MKKREQGVLTIEASIVLTIFLLLVLFLFSFGRIYRAQNMVSHAVLQSADALALESYLRELAHREDAEEIVKLGNELSGVTSFNADNFTSLRSADVPKLAREKFIPAVASSEANADAKLKQLGVKDGLQGLDFSQSKMDLANNDVIVHVTYTLEMQFPIWGFNEITVTKAGKAKTFGDILFEIVTIPNDDRKGSASGGGSYKHGETIQITAEAKYGYHFEGWDDDGDGMVDDASNPRTITVLDAQTYTAIFKNNGYAVNATVTPKDIEGITFNPAPNAQGVYDYGNTVELTVSNQNPHYIFTGWTGQLLQDKDGDGYEETSSAIPNPRNEVKYVIPEVQGNYHLNAKFSPKQYQVTVEAKDGGSATIKGTTAVVQSYTYPETVSLVATPLEGYAVDYWMKDGVKMESSVGQTRLNNLPVESDVKYTAVFKNVKVKVKFLDASKNVIEEFALNSGQSFNSAGIKVPSYPVVDGKILEGWKNFNANTVIRSDTSVEGNWIRPSITIKKGAATNVKASQLSVDVYPSTLKNAKISWHTEVGSGTQGVATVNNNGVVEAIKPGWIEVHATLEYKGITCKDIVSIEVAESQHVLGHCMIMGYRVDKNGNTIKNSQMRFYYKNHMALIGTDKTIKNNNKVYVFKGSRDHHCWETMPSTHYYTKPTITYSSLIKMDTVDNDEYMGGKYFGYNKSGEVGYIFKSDGYNNKIYYELEIKGNTPRGYFIKGIHY